MRAGGGVYCDCERAREHAFERESAIEIGRERENLVLGERNCRVVMSECIKMLGSSSYKA